jgi:hypothetical protein
MSTRTAIFRVETEGDGVVFYTSGSGSRYCQCDRRTFNTWVKRLGIKPLGTLDGNRAIYKTSDVERIAKAIKEGRKKS